MEPTLSWIPVVICWMLNSNYENSYMCVYHEIFYVPKEVAKVDVEEVSGGSDHDVVIVTIPYAL